MRLHKLSQFQPNPFLFHNRRDHKQRSQVDCEGFGGGNLIAIPEMEDYGSSILPAPTGPDLGSAAA